MDKKMLGTYGEQIAGRYLMKKGYTLIDHNFHSRYGEIDLIVKKEDTIVFVEVKTRDAHTLFRPAEAVTLRKQRRIKSTALYFLARMEGEVNVRFDVVEVLIQTSGIKKVKVNHIENAFG